MNPNWMKQLNDAAAFTFTIAATHPFWPAHNFEPLIVTILFPYLKHRPFQLRSTPKIFGIERRLPKVFQMDQVDEGDILLKYLFNIVELPSMYSKRSRCCLFDFLDLS